MTGLLHGSHSVSIWSLPEDPRISAPVFGVICASLQNQPWLTTSGERQRRPSRERRLLSTRLSCSDARSRLEEPKPKPAKIRALSYEAAPVVQTHAVV